MITWYLLRTGVRSPAENMALDEVLLNEVANLAGPVLRFYGWSEPAASFGYFQRYSEVEGLTGLRPLVRRPTGGGVVPHDADWTYSLVFPPQHPWYRLKALDSYQRLHGWLRRAFHECGVSTAIAEISNKSVPGHCFAGPERFDLLWRGQKIAGAAQRRSRQGLLIQGSIQPPEGLNRKMWEDALAQVAVSDWSAHWKPCDITAEMQQQSQHLAREKYGRAEYNRKR